MNWLIGNNSDYLLEVIIGKQNEGAFWDTGNVLYLAMDDYMNMYIYKSLSRGTLKSVHFTTCMFYLNKKFKKYRIVTLSSG